ncbi:MAG TPA: hypothetical protein VMR52_05075 [Dehalococcoidia bacterium]|nr:hypothetical protein [Dehalococcoidia bacterium]
MDTKVLETTTTAITGVRSVDVTEIYVSQQFTSPEYDSPSPTEPLPPNESVGISEEPFGYFDQRVVVEGYTYRKRTFLFNVRDHCPHVEKACLEVLAADCLQLIGPCNTENKPYETLNVEGVDYIRPDSKSDWEEQSRDDPGAECAAENTANELASAEFEVFPFVTKAEDAGEQELNGRTVTIIEAEFEIPPLDPTDGCPRASSPITGLAIRGLVKFWIDPETSLPLQMYREDNILQNDTLLVGEYRLATYGNFNETQLPGPLPE